MAQRTVSSLALLVVVGFLPLAEAQTFSEWRQPVNLGSTVNSSAFDG